MAEAKLQKIEISHKTIIFTAVFLIFLWFLYLIRSVLLQLFVALLIMAILNTSVVWLKKYKIPRPVSVAVLYVLLIGVVGWIIAGIVPPLVDQSTSFATSLPEYLQSLSLPGFVNDRLTEELAVQVGKLPSQLLKVSISVFNNALAILGVLIIALYLLLARDKLDDQLTEFFGKSRSKQIMKVVDSLESRLGGWARGELILMFVVGLATYIGLLVLGIPFALPLALLSGVLEAVPTLGPLLSAVPVAIVGFNQSTVTGFASIALMFLIQQLENYLLVPNIMKKSVGVSPVITLVALIVGFKIAGIAGAILSVPLVITIQVISTSLLKLNSNGAS